MKMEPKEIQRELGDRFHSIKTDKRSREGKPGGDWEYLIYVDGSGKPGWFRDTMESFLERFDLPLQMKSIEPLLVRTERSIRPAICLEIVETEERPFVAEGQQFVDDYR